MWFSNRSDTNRPVQSQKRARGLKFWGVVEEELYYPSSKNEGADLRLCFCICRLLVFPCGGSFIIKFIDKIFIIKLFKERKRMSWKE